MQRFVYLNGQWLDAADACVSIEDRGFLFADGVYEVVRYYNSRAIGLPEHVERLRASLAALRIDLGDDPPAFDALSDEAVARNRLADATTYWQVTRGSAKRDHPIKPDLDPTVLVIAYPVPELDVKAPAPTVTAVLVDDERWANCWIKSLMLLPNVLAMSKARDAGADEATPDAAVDDQVAKLLGMKDKEEDAAREKLRKLLGGD